jgi:SAM-dependent methyltransferase
MPLVATRERVDEAIDTYVRDLAALERVASQTDEPATFRSFEEVTAKVLAACASYEGQASEDDLAAARRDFRERTAPWFSQSVGMSHTRNWPRGYQGDYEVLEWIYAGVPQSVTTLGVVLDTYLLSRAMAAAARGRLASLCGLLRAELRSRSPEARVLSVACGSCRDLFQLALEVCNAKSYLTCVDRDKDALRYARRLLLAGGIATERVSLLQMNALRLVSLPEARKRLGTQDVIYSVGFFDYLDDERVARLLKTWYELLRPGGAMIVAMKDVTAFDPRMYRWLIDWTAFHGRTEASMSRLFDEAGIPKDQRRTSRDETGIVVFWRASR